MIYAVNTRSKEHKALPDYFSQDASFYLENGDRWDIIRTDDDGWIEWDVHPGKSSPMPRGSFCDIRHEDGFEAENCLADAERWSGKGAPSGCRIIAYRPALDAKPSEPEAPRYVKVVGIDFSAYDWWTEGKQYEVIAKGGVEGVKADDGDFYPLDGGRLARGGCFVPWPGEPEPPTWDGEGLPPVGVECEYNIENHPMEEWRHAIIVGHYANRAVFCMPGDKVALSEDGFPRFFSSGAREDFRPIRSAEDRAVTRIQTESQGEVGGPISTSQALRIYHAIRDGKVPGVKLEDT